MAGLFHKFLNHCPNILKSGIKGKNIDIIHFVFAQSQSNAFDIQTVIATSHAPAHTASKIGEVKSQKETHNQVIIGINNNPAPANQVNAIVQIVSHLVTFGNACVNSSIFDKNADIAGSTCVQIDSNIRVKVSLIFDHNQATL